MIRLCWCLRDATHVTSGELATYLCEEHAREVETTVRVERIYQDGADAGRCGQCGDWVEIGAYGVCSDCLDEMDRSARGVTW